MKFIMPRQCGGFTSSPRSQDPYQARQMSMIGWAEENLFERGSYAPGEHSECGRRARSMGSTPPALENSDLSAQAYVAASFSLSR